MTGQEDKKLQQIVYSCYVSRSREGEQFVQEHIFSYQISGTLVLNDGNKESIFRAGDFRFVKRNHLLKFIKQPPQSGEFKTVSIYFDQETLRNFSMEYGYTAREDRSGDGPIVALKPSPLYKSYMDSLMPYEQLNDAGHASLLSIKAKEAILILLQANPELAPVLFDFSEPGKIDLEAFMNKNFHFNVELKRFAYLTGRSLATFKRDFEKIFHLSKSRLKVARLLPVR